MKHNINIIGQVVALLSFVIGTILLAVFLYFGENVMGIGFAFATVVVLLIINIVLFTVVLGSTLLNSHRRKEGWTTCGLMLLNIPITIGYFYIVITYPTFNF